jgi:transcriptional regulator with XRE-family HTH domain
VVALEAGISPGLLSMYTSGGAQPTAEKAQAVSAALGLGVTDLFPPFPPFEEHRV